MATRLYLRTLHADCQIGWGYQNLRGTVTGFNAMPLSTSKGAGVAAGQNTNTVTGPTAGIEANGEFSFGTDWISPPLAADVTISGTITANIWAAENSMSANVAINCQILIARANDEGTGWNVLQEIVKSTRVTELALTTRAVNNFTTGMTSGAYTGQTANRGDRLIVRPFGDDAGTMASGFSFNIGYNGATDGADGDTWVEFTETITFETTDPPAGSTVYFTDTASAVSSSLVDKEAWTSRGAGAVTAKQLGQIASTTLATTHVGNPVAPDAVQTFAGGTNNADGDLKDPAFRAAQSLTMTAGDVAAVQFRTRKTGSPADNLIVELQGDSGGSPDGVAVATVTIAAASLSAGGFPTRALFSATATLTAATYWLVFYRSGALDNANYVQVLGSTTSAYAGGLGKNSTNSGGSWNTNAGLLDYQCGVEYVGIQWFTKRLQAVTLGGMAKANIRVASSSPSSAGSFRVEIARVDADGTNATIWATWGMVAVTNDGGYPSSTSEAARVVYPSGDDLSISDGQRLRIRVLESVGALGDLDNVTVTFWYGGTSGGATGDSYVIFPQTLLEFVETYQPRNSAMNLATSPAVL